MATPAPTKGTTAWIMVAWNLFIVVWVVVGHPGVRNTTGEGHALAINDIVILWMVGNAVVVGVWLIRRSLHSRRR